MFATPLFLPSLPIFPQRHDVSGHDVRCSKCSLLILCLFFIESVQALRNCCFRPSLEELYLVRALTDLSGIAAGDVGSEEGRCRGGRQVVVAVTVAR